MTTAKYQRALEPGAKLIREAIAREGITRAAVGKAAGVSSQTISGYVTAKVAPKPATAHRLGKLLGLDPDLLVHPGKKTRPAVGPAQRAVALATARDATTLEVPPPLQGASRAPPGAMPNAPGVFGIEARSDGTMAIWVRATLPYERGAAFLRAMLDFGLVGDDEKREIKDG